MATVFYEDFVGFSFRGYHSKDLGLYRVSDGSRYNDKMTPEITDKTTNAPDNDGVFLFNTNHTKRTFSIQVAFDQLTEGGLRKLRQVFNGKDMGPLIFDETPYKAYEAKLASAPQFKYLCFDEGGRRIYKGEGTLEFVSYYPYAHSINFDKKDGRLASSYNEKVYTNKSEWYTKGGEFNPVAEAVLPGDNYGDVPAPFIATLPVKPVGAESPNYTANTKMIVGNSSITITEEFSTATWNSKTGIVYGKKPGIDVEVPLSYLGDAVAAIPTEKNGAFIVTDGLDLKYNFWYY